MANINVLKTKAEVISEFKALGQTKFDIKTTKQARNIMCNFPGFPLEHFKAWFIKNYMVATGSHMNRYINEREGLADGLKKQNKSVEEIL